MLRTLLTGLLVFAAAGGGVAWTAVTVTGADRTAPTTVWEKPEKTPSEDDPAPNAAKGRQDNPLSRQLLPVPANYRLGPDIDEFGNDVHLTGAQATALMEQGGADLPPAQRREHRKFVRNLDVQGLAMRSYVLYSNDLAVEIQLAHMKNRKAVRELATGRKQLVKELSILRDGPGIKGYRDAACLLPPKDEESDLELMLCTAHQDDMLVTLTASGTKPFREDDVADLLKKQLDRLAKGGGQYV
ncbi:hypothetical protein [Streptomyces sp. JJ36]|uniref:hypothetical protein n=1 Tax=Streptomyces sp. JJ36 TaxID=2736645 RepID=UPI001F491C24|nr:hypothetical protein [Streptomyces sp. JJ36]MCF6524165.1 hypothetical protein [Streptomyces sp. JJ36]